MLRGQPVKAAGISPYFQWLHPKYLPFSERNKTPRAVLSHALHEGWVGKDEGARCFSAPADRASTTCSGPSITPELLKMCSTPSRPQFGAAGTDQAVPWQGAGVQMPPQEPRDDCRPSHSLQQLWSSRGLHLNNRQSDGKRPLLRAALAPFSRSPCLSLFPGQGLLQL